MSIYDDLNPNSTYKNDVLQAEGYHEINILAENFS